MCPRCHSRVGFRAVTLQKGNDGLLLLIFGGIVPYLLFRSPPQDQLLCERCGFVFRPIKWPAGRNFAVVALFVAAVIAVAICVLSGVANRWPPVSPANNALRQSPADSP